MTITEFRDVLLRFFVLISIMLFLSLFLDGCGDKCENSKTYYYYEPVYTPMSEIRAAVALESPREMEVTGKIYLYENTLLINEPGMGIHVIDNSNPSNPVFKHFINIPGNFDMAVKNNILYADSYMDIVAINLSDNNFSEVHRIEDVYHNINSFGIYPDAELGVVTDWEKKETIESFETECDGFNNGGILRRGGGWLVDIANDAVFTSESSFYKNANVINTTGIAGSMARFAITGNSLYAIDDWQLYVFDISNQIEPDLDNTIELGWGIETIFPYKNNLFIGANNGMHIYDNSNPAEPVYLSSFMHFTACDPVVVNDDYAFVTLRSENACQGFVNQLDVINIQDLSSPSLVKSYTMKNPHGLGIDNTSLFLCEGEFGLKVYDIDDIHAIDDHLIEEIKGINAFDVIPFQNNLILIGDDGLYQYDYSDPENLKLLSHLSVNLQ